MFRLFFVSKNLKSIKEFKKYLDHQDCSFLQLAKLLDILKFLILSIDIFLECSGNAKFGCLLDG